MSYRTLLVALDRSARTRARVAVAAALAQRHGAHLIGVAALGWALIPAEATAAFGLAAYQEAALRELREQAQACVRDFEQQVARLGVASYEGRIEDGFSEVALSLAARYSDLTVLSQADPDDATPSDRLLPEEVLLQSGRPVLVLPYAGEPGTAPAMRILAAWNGSREAARALRDALPLLRAASQVEVVVFETPQDIDLRHGPLPGADIGLWLARHGVNVQARHVPVKVGAGEALLSHAADMGADLIVAGGYGHARLREAVLGGVTRTLLGSSPVPVLLSH